MREVEFASEGATLRGLLYLPDAKAGKAPLVVMAHGTSATIHMVADKYAEAFCRAGLAALLYDHRNFGASGGRDASPRQASSAARTCFMYSSITCNAKSSLSLKWW